MVGDMQRIKEYPAKGFQIEQGIPNEVWQAYEFLVAQGYNKRLIKDLECAITHSFQTPSSSAHYHNSLPLERNVLVEEYLHIIFNFTSATIRAYPRSIRIYSTPS